MEELLIKRLRLQVNGIRFNLKFMDRLTLVDGETGVGKTMLFKAIKRKNLENVICLNWVDSENGNLQHVLETARNKVIIIDNGDVALNIKQRFKVSLDDNNQYIVFCHNTYGFKPVQKSISRLKVEDNKGFLDFWLYEHCKKNRRKKC